MALGSLIILIGVVCIIAAIIGGGLKISVPSVGGIDAAAIQSIRRQILLACFGFFLIVGGAAANENSALLEWWQKLFQRSPVPASIHSSPPIIGTVQGPQSQKQVAVRLDASGNSKTKENDTPSSNDVVKIQKAPRLIIAELVPSAVKKPNYPDVCSNFERYTPSSWKVKFLHSANPGTWHVFVYSLPQDSTEEDAIAKANEWRNRFVGKGVNFGTLETVNASTQANDHWALVLASGISSNLAAKVVRFAKTCGIAPDAFAVMMQ